jgi:hypothetical protein
MTTLTSIVKGRFAFLDTNESPIDRSKTDMILEFKCNTSCKEDRNHICMTLITSRVKGC